METCKRAHFSCLMPGEVLSQEVRAGRKGEGWERLGGHMTI